MTEFIHDYATVLMSLKWVILFVATLVFLGYAATKYGPINEDQIR